MATPDASGGGSSSGAVEGFFSFLGGERANRASRRESQRNRDYQAMMSNTAHQREVQDLRAAGLNPILSGLGGSGAATSAGSMAQQIDTMTPAVTSAREGRRNYEETRQMSQQTKLIREQEKKTIEETASAVSAKRVIDLQAEVIELQMPSHELDAKINRSEMGEIYRHMEKGGASAGAIASMLAGIKAFFTKKVAKKIIPKLDSPISRKFKNLPPIHKREPFNKNKLKDY